MVQPPVGVGGAAGGVDVGTTGNAPGVVGIIYPPPQMRPLIEKTAEFVHRNGPQFVQKIMSQDDGSDKFRFLMPKDPYHNYYLYKLRELKEGIVLLQPDAPAGVPVGEEMRSSEAPSSFVVSSSSELAAVEAGTGEPLPASVRDMPKEIKKPEPNIAYVPEPRNMSPFDVDLIQLTALFVARNGKNFLSGIGIREARNPKFDFIRPLHPFFAYFTQLVDAYSTILVANKERIVRLKGESGDKFLLWERIKNKVEWHRLQETTKMQRDQEIDADRVANALIDWHDFKIVETITFDGVSTPALPAAGQRNLTEDVEMTTDDRVTSMPDIIPRPPAKKEETQVCPRCGVRIPISEMREHMRIELLDPRWREQKNVEAEKLKTAHGGYAGGEEIVHSLRAFSEQRKDIFGDWDTEMKNVTSTEKSASTADLRAISRDGSDRHGHATRPLVAVPLMPPPVPFFGAGAGGSVSTAGVRRNIAPPVPVPAGGLPPVFSTPSFAQQQRVAVTAEPPSKRQRVVEDALVPEQEWIEKHPGDVSVSFEMGDSKARVDVSVTRTIGEVKDLLVQHDGFSSLVPKKVRLNCRNQFLKEALTLAFYNIDESSVVLVSVKERGGRKR